MYVRHPCLVHGTVEVILKRYTQINLTIKVLLRYYPGFFLHLSLNCDKVCGSPSMDRSSRPEVFCEKGVLKDFSKFTGKYLCQGLFFNKVASMKPFYQIIP